MGRIVTSDRISGRRIDSNKIPNGLLEPMDRLKSYSLGQFDYKKLAPAWTLAIKVAKSGGYAKAFPKSAKAILDAAPSRYGPNTGAYDKLKMVSWSLGGSPLSSLQPESLRKHVQHAVLFHQGKIKFGQVLPPKKGSALWNRAAIRNAIDNNPILGPEDSVLLDG
jgi:hypothetical protein